MKNWIYVLGVVSILFFTGNANAAIVVNAGDLATAGGNCFPFSCSGFGADPGTRYQQVYNSSLFSSPFIIEEVAFFPYTEYGDVAINNGFYELNFSTTTKLVNGLDAVNFNNNIGTNDALFFSGDLGGAVTGSSFSLSGNAFYYDPSVGNLLLDIKKTDVAGEGAGYFLANNGTFGDTSSRAHNFGTGYESYGLVTRFIGSEPSNEEPNQDNNEDPNKGGRDPSVVPEPMSIILLGLGMGFFAARKRG